ncbi:exonuclease domain-containing protein [Pseudogemmobacter sonorensis]|uniref:exonuclease domain-containing protein n=1 Tax=Pseudogemmobacter sonorensis TaxID=2989681 RepID=UPI0036885D5B
MALLSWLFGKKNQPETPEKPTPDPSLSFAVPICDHTETFDIELTPDQAKALADAQEYRDTHKPDLPALPDGPFRFIALDVETANDDPASICQIGLAFVRPDNSIITWAIYVDPDDDFSPSNISIHGISEDTIIDAEAPFFEHAMAHIAPTLSTNTVFQHSDFDRRCIAAACDACDIDMPAVKWADSVRVAQRAWPELKGNGGHGLASLRDYLGLSFRHHDGEEDARASAEVVLRAENTTGSLFQDLVMPAKRRPRYAPPTTREASPDGPLAGHVAVFTGALSMSREEAANIAANNGITVAANVTKKTTILIVGDQDLTLLAGHSKSSKHRKAEEYIANGQDVRILGEQEFLAIIRRP